MINHAANTRMHHNVIARSTKSGIRQHTSAKAYIDHNTIAESASYAVRVTSSATEGEIRDNILAKSEDTYIRANMPAHHNIEADTLQWVRFVDPQADIFDLREDSPARGQASDGGDPGALPYGRPVPARPRIELFGVTPREVQVGTQVELAWRVSGARTDVQISGTDLSPVSGLAAEGAIPFTPQEVKTYQFVLTAYNDDLKAEATGQLTATEEIAPTSWPPKPYVLHWLSRLRDALQEVADILSEGIVELEK
jgi:hypothetical protein